MDRRPFRALLERFDAERGASDAELLDRFLADREEGAFAALLERYGPLVLHVCRRILPEPHDAEDVFQATFLLLIKKAASIRKRESLASWLHGTAYRLAVQLRRQTARRKQREQKQEQPQSAREPGYEAAWRELQEVLDEELTRLPARLRAPLLLCYFQGKTHEEAARQLGWPLGTVRSRVARAREALRGRLQRRGLAVPAVVFGAALATRGVAAVPVSLTSTTLAAGTAVVAGKHTVGLVSAQAAALIEGALKTMTAIKLCLGLAMLFAVGTALACLVGPATEPEEDRPTVLAKSAVPGKGGNGRDALGDPLPPGAVGRLGTSRLFGVFIRPTFTPDSRAVVTSDYQGNLYFWDVTTGRELRRLGPAPVGHPEHPGVGVPSQIVFTQDGKQVATLHAHAEIFVRDAETGKVLQKIAAVQGWGGLRYFALSPDGKYLIAPGTGGDVHNVLAWEVASGKPLAPFAPVSERVRLFRGGQYCLSFAPDSRHAALGLVDGTIRLWDVTTGKETRKIDAHRAEVASLAFSPDGKALASVSSDGFIRLWDATSGESIRHWQPRGLGRRFASDGLAFAEDGKRLVLRGRGVARAWRVATGEEITLRGPDLADRLDSAPLAFFAEGEQEQFTEQQELSPDGRVLATARPGTRLCLHNPSTGGELVQFTSHEGPVQGVAVSSAGVIATGGADRTVRLWDPASGKQFRVLRSHVSPVHFLAFSPDSKRLTSAGVDDRVISIWDVESGKELRQLRSFGFVLGLHFMAGSDQLMALGTETVWDLGTGKVTRQPEGFLNHPATVSSDSRLMASLRVNLGDAPQPKVRDVYLADPTTGKSVRTFKSLRPGREDDQDRSYSPTCMALSPDRRTLLIGFGGKMPEFVLFDTVLGRPTRVLPRPVAGTGAFTMLGLPFGGPFYLPDGRLVIHADAAGKVHLLEIASGQDRHVFDPHHGGLRTLALSPDGKTLVTTGSDGTALVWDPRTFEPAAGAELGALWNDLAGDAPRAGRAVVALVADPDRSVPFIANRVRAATAPDAGRIEKLIKDLDSRKLQERKDAEAELDRLGMAAKPYLEKALGGKPSLHATQRLEALLAKLEGSPLPVETIRHVRAVEALEAIATPAARRLIEKLAAGAEGDPLTVDAQAALDRLQRRPG